MRVKGYQRLMPDAAAALGALHESVMQSPLGQSDPKLVELLKLRVSQINGCAYCVDMHSKDARAIGEEEQRLYMVSVWREAHCFSERERAALAWAESLTRLPENDVPDELFEELARHFSEQEVVAVTWVIVEINAWNQLGVGFRYPVGSYVSNRGPAVAAAVTS